MYKPFSWSTIIIYPDRSSNMAAERQILETENFQFSATVER